MVEELHQLIMKTSPNFSNFATSIRMVPHLCGRRRKATFPLVSFSPEEVVRLKHATCACQLSSLLAGWCITLFLLTESGLPRAAALDGFKSPKESWAIPCLSRQGDSRSYRDAGDCGPRGQDRAVDCRVVGFSPPKRGYAVRASKDTYLRLYRGTAFDLSRANRSRAARMSRIPQQL